MTITTVARIVFVAAMLVAFVAAIGLTVLHSLSRHPRIGFVCLGVFCVCIAALPIVGQWTEGK